jgi:hypothetical protein
MAQIVLDVFEYKDAVEDLRLTASTAPNCCVTYTNLKCFLASAASQPMPLIGTPIGGPWYEHSSFGLRVEYKIEGGILSIWRIYT